MRLEHIRLQTLQQEQPPMNEEAQNLNRTESRLLQTARRSRFFSFWKKSPPTSRNISIPSRVRNEFPPNIIRNQRYSVLSFIPVVLFEQFAQFYNFTFLLISLSQLWEPLRVGLWWANLMPLAFIISVTFCKEAFDDFQRYRRDVEINSEKVDKMTEDGFVKVSCAKIKVGDLLRLEKNQKIPADMILLRTTDQTGSVFIRTDQLDGETDWKMRVALSSTQKLHHDEDLLKINASIYADRPIKDIYEFIGTFSSEKDKRETVTESLSVENTLWMNTVLASSTVIGCVVYTGKDSRAQMNMSDPVTKTGLIDAEINKFCKILMVLLILASGTLVALRGFHLPSVVYFFRFIILFSSIIPLSLRVNLDMGRLVYKYLLSKDKQLPNVIVRTTTIPEELGRVQYLLTDKTGTLTKNDMELKRIHMGTVSYGNESSADIRAHLAASSSQIKSMFEQPDAKIYPNRAKRDISSRVYDLVSALSVCHNVTPTEENGVISYQASSPDEVAIVKWTESVGMTLFYRSRTSIQVQNALGDILEFQVLYVFPFTSETKRMGILVLDKQTGEHMFFQKGADNVMAQIVQHNDWLEEECGNMAREGLRTLVIGRKRISAQTLAEFEIQYDEAKMSIQNRNQNMQDVISRFLENDLELLGVTGVEDKLQDDVKITLELLRNAGVKIWMLTGDKIETATCIAVSSKLVNRTQQLIQLQKITTAAVAERVLNDLSSRTDRCIVIDGASLQTMLDFFPVRFIAIASTLSAVVCCRCSPTQKADVARLVGQHTGKRVCCIGDGGNDVSMIQAADIGIGIVGREGLQASLAADYSVEQFKSIGRLLLWHGRNSYKTTAKLSQFVFHRGIVISMMQGIFSALFFYSPISIYSALLMQGYATFYTNFSVFSITLDHDVSDEVAMMYPELYKELVKGRAISMKTFLTWIGVSVYQGTAIMLLGIWLFETELLNFASITFFSLLLNELLMVALQIHTWHIMMFIAEFGSVVMFIASVLLFPSDFDLQFAMSIDFWTKVLIMIFVSFFPFFLFKVIHRCLSPPSYAKLNQ